LLGPVLVVKVVEAAAQTLVEDVGATKGKGAIRTDRPPSSEDSTSLGWLVELELVVGSNVTGATNVVSQYTTLKSDLESGVVLASNHLSANVSLRS